MRYVDELVLIRPDGQTAVYRVRQVALLADDGAATDDRATLVCVGLGARNDELGKAVRTRNEIPIGINGEQGKVESICIDEQDAELLAGLAFDVAPTCHSAVIISARCQIGSVAIDESTSRLGHPVAQLVFTKEDVDRRMRAISLILIHEGRCGIYVPSLIIVGAQNPRMV